MSARVEAAAKATRDYADEWCADFAEVLSLGDRSGEHMRELAQASLSAADAVMFSEAAIERAAQTVASGFPWYNNYQPAIVQEHVRAVVSALREEA